MKKLNFYFDFLSPYSYLAFNCHRDIIPENTVNINYRPVLMGKLFSQHGFPGPGEIPAKRKHELRKCFRLAHNLNIKFHPPKTFPFNPLGIVRLATNYASAGKQFEVISTIFDLVWGQGIILEDPDLILSKLNEAGFQEEIFHRSFERDAKLELKTNIKDALSQDIFGVPSFEVEGEMFWGLDSLEDLKNFLMGNDMWNRTLYNELLELKN